MSEAYSKPCQTSTMELFAKIRYGWKLGIYYFRKKLFVRRPFQERQTIARARAVYAQKRLEVWWIARVNQTFDHTLLLNNFLCLIKICAYSYVTINWRLSLIIKLKWSQLVFWFWKLLILHRNQKGFLLSPV